MSVRIQQIAAAIARFEEAVRAHETKGAQRPEDIKDIVEEYNESLAHLTDLIAESINERMA
jgi:hypothetical protein